MICPGPICLCPAQNDQKGVRAHAVKFGSLLVWVFCRRPQGSGLISARRARGGPSRCARRFLAPHGTTEEKTRERNDDRRKKPRENFTSASRGQASAPAHAEQERRARAARPGARAQACRLARRGRSTRRRTKTARRVCERVCCTCKATDDDAYDAEGRSDGSAVRGRRGPLAQSAVRNVNKREEHHATTLGWTSA